jgi:hypothetical protein
MMIIKTVKTIRTRTTKTGNKSRLWLRRMAMFPARQTSPIFLRLDFGRRTPEAAPSISTTLILCT